MTAIDLTPAQLSIIMDEIAQAAIAIEGLALELGKAATDETPSHLIDATMALAQKVGWLADMGGSATKGDAPRWFLPPLFHHQRHQAQAVTSAPQQPL